MKNAQDFDKTQTPFDVLDEVAKAVKFSDADDALNVIGNASNYFTQRAESGEGGKTWATALEKLADVIRTNKPRFSIFAKNGNVKLPFVAYSALPGVTCPGAGDCLEFCYSFTAWRYPNAFCRQAQNTWLERSQTGLSAIRSAFSDLFKTRKLKDGFDFRLYVDGDFSDVSTLYFWQTLLKDHSSVRAYGYSKSLTIFKEYAKLGHSFANNYLLNLSSGHNADGETVEYIKTLPCYRGEFIAVDMGKTVKAKDHNNPDHKRRLVTIHKASTGTKAFPCPGKCGSCTSKGHACGSSAFKGIAVVIGIH